MNEQNSIQFLLKAFPKSIDLYRIWSISEVFTQVFSMPYVLFKSHNGSKQIILSFLFFAKYFRS